LHSYLIAVRRPHSAAFHAKARTAARGIRPTRISIANIAFSLCAAVASLLIAILAAAKGAPVVAIVWGLLAIGFVLRAAYGYRRHKRK
jgi:hypothetical protein